MQPRHPSRSPVRDRHLPAQVRHDRVIGVTLRRLRDLGHGGYGFAILCAPTTSPLRMRAGSPVRGAAGVDPRFPDHVVVVKLTRLATLGPADRQQALAEAVTLRKLAHPHIVPCLDAWVEEGACEFRGHLAIAMPYCEAGDLSRYIQTNAAGGSWVPFADVVRILHQALSALDYVHGCKLLHRDVKPANVFLRDAGRIVMLGDFGVSRQLDFTAQAAHTYVGTPAYMPPEVLSGAPYDAAADVWGLGVLAYELMTGTRPFGSRDVAKIHAAVTTVDPIPALAAAARGKYPAELVALVGRMLHKAADGRPTAAELAAGVAALAPPARTPSPPKALAPLVVLRSPSKADSPLAAAAAAPSPAARVRAMHLVALRDTVLLKARASMREGIGRDLRLALGSQRLSGLVEAAIAIYGAEDHDAGEAALRALFTAFPPAAGATECLRLARCHYFDGC